MDIRDGSSVYNSHEINKTLSNFKFPVLLDRRTEIHYDFGLSLVIRFALS